MSSNTEPDEAPPSYSAATDPSSSSSGAPQQSASHLQVPQAPRKARNGIPPDVRRSMEDENRDLPPGWVRQFDPQTHHQFYVDSKATPPRSIWHHPYDDEHFMNSLSPTERDRIHALHPTPSRADIAAESSDDDSHHDYSQSQKQSQSHGHPELPPRPAEGSQATGVSKLGRRMKDKLTSSTHAERELERQRRAEAEQRAYEQHQHTRRQLSKAMQTGVPQLLGTDPNGRNVYIEPPAGAGGYLGGYGNGYGYNPYVQGPYHADPNGRYLRPRDPYDRPYGYGYGGGMGLPLLGGLGGGLLLGGLLF